MPNTLTVRVQGADTASLKFKYLIKAAQKGLALSVPEAALLFQEEAKSIVPVDTGRLRDGIHTEQVTDELDRQVLMVTPVVEASNKEGFDPPYARRIEYGFVGADSLGRIYNQAAQPYMRPAFDSKSAEATAVIKNGIIDALDEAASLRR